MQEKSQRRPAEPAAANTNKRRERETAQDRLVTGNIGYAVKLAHEYSGRGLADDDLVSEATMGMIEASRHFDPSLGKPFVTYAAPYIRQAVERALAREGGLYRVPRDAANPALDHHRSHALSIDAPVAGTMEKSLGRSLPDPNADDPAQGVESEEQRRRMIARLDRLDDRERQVISRLYGLGTDAMTMAQVGELMGLRRERVRQIRDRALRRLRKKD